MEKQGETVVNAIASENSFRLEELDLPAFKRSGGSLEGTAYEEELDE